MPVDVMETGTMERTSIVQRTSNAMRYLINRRQQLEGVHRQRADEFAQGAGSHYTDLPALVRAYFAKWNHDYSVVKAQYEKRIHNIENDKNMSSVEKFRELQRILPPMYPAWSEVQEEAYIRTYGDPRGDATDWNAAIAEFKRPVLMSWSGESEMEFKRGAWEIFMMEILEHPEIDGSVAPCFEMTREQSSASTVIDGIVRTRAAFAPPVPDGQVDAAFYEAMLKAAAKVCPHCLESFGKLKEHERACSKRHGVPSVFSVTKTDPMAGVGTALTEDDETDAGDAADEDDDEPVLLNPRDSSDDDDE